MKLTPAQVKNLMRRGLRFLVDPEPEKKDKKCVRDFFKDSCAYCGKSLENGDGDIDHLVSAALGGANALANRVLSCKPCNAEEKRDRNWIEFLKEKCDSHTTFQERESRIQQWIEMNGGHPKLDPDISALLDQESERTTKEYDAACRQIRKQKQANESLSFVEKSCGLTMPQGQESGARAVEYGLQTASKIAEKLGGLKIGITRSNEYEINNRKVVIKCAKIKTDSVGVAYQMLDRVAAILGSFEIENGTYDIYELVPDVYRANMRPTHSTGSAAGQVGIVKKSVFIDRGRFLINLCID
jgi:ribosomal protein L24E